VRRNDVTETAGMRRIRNTLIIHRIVVIVLIALLLYMTLYFQHTFQAKNGNLRPFYNSLIATLLIQVALFFPIRKFADQQANRELGAATKGTLTIDEQKQLHTQRLFSDFIKASVFIFFAVFIIIAPPAGFVLSTTFFCCIGTVVSYLQNFNFAVRRLITC
jgi:hypothetical protein